MDNAASTYVSPDPMERGGKLKWWNSGEKEVAVGMSPVVNRNKSSGAICKQNDK